MARMDQPETYAECRTFERVAKGYARLGLCDVCAAQASYGHQHGFRAVLPPCQLCLETVETFDYHAPNGWRKASKEHLRRPTGWSSTTDDTQARTMARDDLTRIESAA